MDEIEKSDFPKVWVSIISRLRKGGSGVVGGWEVEADVKMLQLLQPSACQQRAKMLPSPQEASARPSTALSLSLVRLVNLLACFLALLISCPFNCLGAME